MKDVFLCHATADKDAYVRVFADRLRQHGISYWLDEAEIGWGDSVCDSINKGLGTSRYVIAFISDAFLARTWPKKEMNAALSLEDVRKCKVLLPLAVASIGRIKAAYPLLGDRWHLKWEAGLEALVDELKAQLGTAPTTAGADGPPDYLSDATTVEGEIAVLEERVAALQALGDDQAIGRVQAEVHRLSSLLPILRLGYPLLCQELLAFATDSWIRYPMTLDDLPLHVLHEVCKAKSSSVFEDFAAYGLGETALHDDETLIPVGGYVLGRRQGQDYWIVFWSTGMEA